MRLNKINLPKKILCLLKSKHFVLCNIEVLVASERPLAKSSCVVVAVTQVTLRVIVRVCLIGNEQIASTNRRTIIRVTVQLVCRILAIVSCWWDVVWILEREHKRCVSCTLEASTI